MRDLLSSACRAAALGVECLRTDFSRDAGITGTGGKDIKTKADVVAQQLILDRLSATGIPVLAEEGDPQAVDPNRLMWIVDPLDGTLNFSRGFPMAAVSIGLWENSKPLLGVVHDVFHDRVYSGVVGQGAWLDGQKIQVSAVAAPGQAVLATGFPSGRNYETESLLQFVHSVQNYKKIRMLGSAAMMLVQVAAGHFDVYEESDIYIWDVAAGLALVQAAGGSFTMAPGTGLFQYDVRATNGHLQAV